jgi:hypothetical protein
MRQLFLAALVIVSGVAPLSAQESGKGACVLDRGQISCGRVVAGQVMRSTGDIDLQSLAKALTGLGPARGLGGGAQELNRKSVRPSVVRSRRTGPVDSASPARQQTATASASLR